MNLILSTHSIDNKVAIITLKGNAIMEVIVEGIAYTDPNILLDKIPTLLNATNAKAAAFLLTSLYVGIEFKVINKKEDGIPDNPHIVNQALIWTLQEHRSRMLYNAHLPLAGSNRTLSVKLK